MIKGQIKGKINSINILEFIFKNHVTKGVMASENADFPS